MLRAAILPIALSGALTAACTAQPARDPEPVAREPSGPGQPAVPTGALTNAASIVGEYRVAGVDGAEVNLPHAITLSITPDTLRYVSQCVTGTWTYRFDGAYLVTEPVVETVCDRGRYPEEDALDALFSSEARVRRTDTNALEIAGGGHRITLYSQ